MSQEQKFQDDADNYFEQVLQDVFDNYCCIREQYPDNKGFCVPCSLDFILKGLLPNNLYKTLINPEIRDSPFVDPMSNNIMESILVRRLNNAFPGTSFDVKISSNYFLNPGDYVKRKCVDKKWKIYKKSPTPQILEQLRTGIHDLITSLKSGNPPSGKERLEGIMISFNHIKSGITHNFALVGYNSEIYLYDPSGSRQPVAKIPDKFASDLIESAWLDRYVVLIKSEQLPLTN